MAAGTLEAVIVGAGGGGRYVPRAALRGVGAARDADAVGVMPGQLDFLNVVVQNPLEQSVGQNFGSVRPSVFLGSDTDQTVCFGGLFEVLVVISAATGAVLYIHDFLIILVAHFVQEGGDGTLNGSVQSTGSNVDLFPAFALDAPCIVQGVVTIGTGGGLDGNDGAV